MISKRVCYLPRQASIYSNFPFSVHGITVLSVTPTGHLETNSDTPFPFLSHHIQSPYRCWRILLFGAFNSCSFPFLFVCLDVFCSFVVVCLFGRAGSMQKFPSQRYNLHHSNDPSHGSDGNSAGSFNHWATRELLFPF